MLPRFPARKPLDLADRAAVERITRRFAPYSDYSFGSLWCWDSDRSCRLAVLHGNLVVRCADYATGEPFYSFLGDHRVVETAATLLAQARREGIAPRLRLIPEAVVAADDRLATTFRVVEDPANRDYVCSVADWVELAGSRFAAHRAKINHLRRRAQLEPYPLDPTDPATQGAMLDLFDRWAAARPPGSPPTEREREALQRLFLPGAAAGMSGCGVSDRGTLRAFSVWEGAAGGGTSIHHFMKTDHTYPGLASLLIHWRSRQLLAAGYVHANVEQDLGLPGLAAFKRSLRPCHFLRKYEIADSSPAAGEPQPAG